MDRTGNSYVAGTHVINDSINILCIKYNSAGSQQWATLYRYPGYGYFAPTGLAIDSSGNAYIIADYGPTYTAPLNGLIIKFNSLNGSMVWARTHVGQYSYSSIDCIKIDKFNNIYLAGNSDSSHLLMRYNVDGDSIWIRKFHPLSCGEGLGISTIDDSLNIISGGIRRRFYSSVYYDSLLVVKYSSTGVLKWEGTYSGGLTYANWVTGVIADQNGNVYIGGGTTPSGYAAFLTMKYDRNGVRQWISIFDPPGSGDNYLRGIALDRTNNALFVTGSAIVNGIQKATTIRYGLITGDSVWVRNDTGTYRYGDSRSIRIDTLGNIYIAGVSSSTGSGAPVDVLSLKYLNNGIRAWITTYNAPYSGIDIGRDLGLDAANNVYVLGTSQSAFQLSDYIVIKYNQLSAVSPISSEIPETFKLNQNYPNPFNPSTRIVFQIPKQSNVNITVYDILGRSVENLVNETVKPGVYEIRLNGTNYASGTYFYRMIADGGIIDTKKFVLIK